MSSSNVDQAATSAFGRRVIQERERRGWTKRDLAAQSGMPLTRVHRIETSPNQSIGIEDVIKLAHAFGVPMSWLVGGSRVRDRVLAAARCTERDDAERAVDAVVHVLELADQIDTLALNTQPTAATTRDLRLEQSARDWGREAAERTRKLWGHPIGPLEDLASLAERDPSILVVLDRLPDTVDGLTVTDPASGYTLIAASTRSTWERQRFTLAHELGHALSNDTVIEAVRSDGRASQAEVAANEFARNLLVPPADLIQINSDANATWNDGEIAELAWTYRVSPSVVAIQLARLKLTPDSVVNRAKSISADTWSALGGWSRERQAARAAAATRSVPPRLVENARNYWKNGLLPLATLSRLLDEDVSVIQDQMNQLKIHPEHSKGYAATTSS